MLFPARAATAVEADGDWQVCRLQAGRRRDDGANAAMATKMTQTTGDVKSQAPCTGSNWVRDPTGRTVQPQQLISTFRHTPVRGRRRQRLQSVIDQQWLSETDFLEIRNEFQETDRTYGMRISTSGENFDVTIVFLDPD